MENSNLPLVTVGVYTYNSSKTVLETLESIKAQTYPKLELIVSDDFSTDKTVPVCKRWISRNKDRFVNTQIIVAEKNTGQSGNYNRALKACHGEWIKDIDGDDMLTPNCVEDYVNYVSEHPDVIFVFGKAEVFGSTKERRELYKKVFDYSFFGLSVQDKYKRLVNGDCCVASPSAFSNVRKRKEIGLMYDERIPMMEDLPMWVRATKMGIDLYFIDKVVCRYRIGGNGVASGKGHKMFELNYHLFYIYYRFAEEYIIDPDTAVDKLAERQRLFYMSCRNSTSYIIGQAIIRPLIALKRLLRWQ